MADDECLEKSEESTDSTTGQEPTIVEGGDEGKEPGDRLYSRSEDKRDPGAASSS